MKSLHVGTYWGIPVKVHWTFSLLFLGVIGFGWYKGADPLVLFSFASFIITMFICVILHEYGHALAARKFGVKTLDIIISPIGGIARLKKLPEKPAQELWVAIAGPLVNLVIASVLFVVLILGFNDISYDGTEELLDLIATPAGFLSLLFITNLILFVFNLIPAFPMDGGRILRAFLSMHYGKVKATMYASTIGRIFSVGFIFIGLFLQHIMLVFIGIFVFVMARSENQQMMIKDRLSKMLALEIMNTQFTKLHLSNTMMDVFQRYIRGGEKNYLVFDSLGNISGVIPELFIKEAYKLGELGNSVNSYMSNTIYYANQEMTLDQLYEDMNLKGVAIAIIKNGDQILGVIDRQMIYNFIQLQLGTPVTSPT